MTARQQQAIQQGNLSYCWMEGNYAIAADRQGMVNISVSGTVRRRKLNHEGGCLGSRHLDYWCDRWLP